MSLDIILGGALVALVAIIGAWFGGRRAGVSSQRDKEKAADNERIIKNMQARVDAESGSIGDAADRLQRDFRRD